MDAPVDRPDRIPGTVTMGLDGPNDLERIRARLSDTAAGLDMPSDRIDELSVALSEVATNAIVHGSGAATISIASSETALIVEVRDRGTGLSGQLPSTVPHPTHPSGRGLWLARQLTDGLDIDSSTSGTTVRITMWL